MSQPLQGPSTSEAVCFRHKNRPTNVSCQNCGKPICADCMRDTPVGYRCPDCAPQSKFALADDMLVTKAIIGVNLAVFVLGFLLDLSGGLSANMLTSSSSELTVNGGLITSAVQTSVGPGGALVAEQIGVANGEWYRMISSGFLHSGLLHIAFNMYFIWVFGQLLEPFLGRARYALLYTVGLLGGAIGAMLYSAPNDITVGASGAAFALLGASLAMAKLRNIDGLTNNLLMIAGINFAIGFIPGLNISIGGHLGGFVVGLLAGALAFGPVARQRTLVTVVLAAAVVGLFFGGLAVAEMRAVV